MNLVASDGETRRVYDDVGVKCALLTHVRAEFPETTTLEIPFTSALIDRACHLIDGRTMGCMPVNEAKDVCAVCDYLQVVDCPEYETLTAAVQSSLRRAEALRTGTTLTETELAAPIGVLRDWATDVQFATWDALGHDSSDFSAMFEDECPWEYATYDIIRIRAYDGGASWMSLARVWNDIDFDDDDAEPDDPQRFWEGRRSAYATVSSSGDTWLGLDMPVLNTGLDIFSTV